MKLNGLILAAGSSIRLGQPKQLVNFQGKSLLASTEEKLLSCCDQVYVVLGYEAHLFKTEITSSQIIINQDWQQGMGNSLAYGSQIASQQADGLLIALVDQPLIPASHYQLMIDSFQQNPEFIIATEYQNSCGAPAIFPGLFFDDLLNCKNNDGAKNIIRNNATSSLTIRCEAAAYDIDSAIDLTKLS
ncbi:MAG: 4-diphosphocytidyl-2C-methyl-D-erythritol kinase [marine bacterium B5-7]|nr:MAG: 4-diphosphocytidyl-2C-methyl-D-erythritol kinase [marine bacterium B5-7]